MHIFFEKLKGFLQWKGEFLKITIAFNWYSLKVHTFHAIIRTGEYMLGLHCTFRLKEQQKETTAHLLWYSLVKIFNLCKTKILHVHSEGHNENVNTRSFQQIMTHAFSLCSFSLMAHMKCYKILGHWIYKM